MTRRLLILSLCIVLTLAAQAKKETQDFVTQYLAELQTAGVSEQDYTCATIGPQMMERVLQMVKDKTLEDNDQIRDALTHVRSIRVFAAIDNTAQFNQTCRRLLERQARYFKPVKSEAQQGNTSSLWVRESKKQIVELVLVAAENETNGERFTIINLTGDFDSEFIDELLKM